MQDASLDVGIPSAELTELIRFETISSVSTNATAPNLPGAGRTVGLLFDRLGSRLESFLSSFASTLGSRPEAVAEEIRRLCHQYGQSPAVPDGHFTDAEKKILKTLCKKLVKYTRSTLDPTRLNALEEIISLAIHDPRLRELMTGYCRKCIMPDPRETHGVTMLSKPICAVDDAKVHYIWSEAISRCLYAPHERRSILQIAGTTPLKLTLSDHRSSFLAARYLKQALSLMGNDCLSLWGHYIYVASRDPHIVEWSNVDACIPYHKYIVATSGTWVWPEDLANIAQSLIREARDVPRIMSRYLTAPKFEFQICENDQTSNVFTLTKVDNWKLEEQAPFCTRFFQELSGSNDIRAHILSVRGINRISRGLLKDTILVNEAFVAYCHLVSYVKAEYKNGFSFRDALRSAIWTSLIPAGSTLVSLLVSDQPETRALATFLVARLTAIDRYCKHIVSLSTPPRPPLITTKIQSMPTTEKVDNLAGKIDFDNDNGARTLLRFRLDEGMVVVSLPPVRDQLERYLREGITRTLRPRIRKQFPEDHCVDVMRIKSGPESVVFIRVNGLEKPFDATGHYPILAGYDTSGNPLYVASSQCWYDPSDPSVWGEHKYYACVPNGASSAKFVGFNGGEFTSHKFYVLALRYNPCDRDPHFPPACTSAIDPTGPVFWLKLWPREDPDLFKNYNLFVDPHSSNSDETIREVAEFLTRFADEQIDDVDDETKASLGVTYSRTPGYFCTGEGSKRLLEKPDGEEERIYLEGGSELLQLREKLRLAEERIAKLEIENGELRARM